MVCITGLRHHTLVILRDKPAAPCAAIGSALQAFIDNIRLQPTLSSLGDTAAMLQENNAIIVKVHELYSVSFYIQSINLIRVLRLLLLDHFGASRDLPWDN